MNQNKIYLGDAVYAEYDGFGIMLTTENGISVTNAIYLEPMTYQTLQSFVEALNTRVRNESIEEIEHG